jgi:hypothetical protein
MNWGQFFKRRSLLWIGLAYLVSRLYALTLLPMFLDEAIHIRWGLRILDGGPLWQPWLHGRLLNVWVNALILSWSQDFLWVSRAPSVLMGLATLLLTYGIGACLFGRGVGRLAAVLYVVCPFTLFFDRMALADTYLAAFAAATCYLCLRLRAEPRRRTAVLLGVAMALGTLAKATGAILFGVPVLTVAILGRRRACLRFVTLAYVVGLGLAGYPLWLFWTNTPLLAKTSLASEAPLSWGLFLSNLALSSRWLAEYWTPGLLLLAGLALARTVQEKCARRFLLACLCLAPILLCALVSVHWYPRYLLPATVPFLVLCATALRDVMDWLRSRLRFRALVPAGAALAVALVAPAARLDWHLWFDPAAAPLPEADRFAYIHGWPSGYGVADAVAFLRQELAACPDGFLVVVPQAEIDVTYRMIELCARRDRRIALERRDLAEPGAGLWLRERSLERPVLVVLTPEFDRLPEGRTEALWTYLGQRVASTFKPDGRPWNEVYRVVSPVGAMATE